MYLSQAAVGESTAVTGKLEQAGHPKGLAGLPAVLINCASQTARIRKMHSTLWNRCKTIEVWGLKRILEGHKGVK